MLLLLLAVTFLGCAVYLAAEAATAPAREHELAVRRATRYGISRLRGTAAPRLQFRERVVTPAIHRLAGLALRVNHKSSVEGNATRLSAAGTSSRSGAKHRL